jgi:predicted  nucleic acid-binding Zn-ribbon protein
MALPRNVSPVMYSHEMTTPADDVPTLQLEVLKRIQAELVRLNQEVTNLKEAVAGVQHAVADVQQEVAGVKSEVAGVKQEVSTLRAETHEGFMRLRTELVELRGDMDVGFTAQRLQNDRRFLDHERRLRELEGRG